MGLGFSIEIPGGWNKEKRLRKLRKYFEKLSSPVPRRCVRVVGHEGGFQVALVPFEEELRVDLGDGGITISAKTNSAGPGYHAYLISLVDKAIRRLLIRKKRVKAEDETGYYHNRDFPALQKSISGWLATVAGVLLQSDSEQPCAVSMPLSIMPVAAGRFAFSQLGYFDRGFFRAVLDDQNVQELCRKFFIWWDQEKNALFYKNCALAAMWNELNWLYPQTKAEEQLYKSVRDCIKQADKLDPGDFPAAAWLEIARLLDDQRLIRRLKARFGLSDGAAMEIGYLRGGIHDRFLGSWRLTRPGMMHVECDAEGGWCWWDDNRTIRASAVASSDKAGEPSLAEIAGDESGSEPFPILEEHGLTARISHTEIEEDEQPAWLTRLFASKDEQLLVLSVFYGDEEDREWAEAVCASVRA